MAATPNSVEAYVNDEPITTQELNLQIKLHRSQILSYFRNKFGNEVTSQKGFWENNYGGEIPAQRAHSLALDTLKRIKIQEILARQKGLISDIRYETLLTNLLLENKRRDSVIANHGVIYGAAHFSEETFFDYVFSNMVIELQKSLANAELKPSLQQLQEYYLLIRKDHFQARDSIRVQEIKIAYADPDTTKNIVRDSAWAILHKIQQQVHAGLDFAKAVKSAHAKMTARIFNDATARNDYTHDGEISCVADTLSVGSVSAIVDNGQELSIIKSVSRQGNGYKPFELVAPIVRAQYIEATYEKYIDSLVQHIKFREANGVVVTP